MSLQSVKTFLAERAPDLSVGEHRHGGAGRGRLCRKGTPGPNHR